jgi:hypothetical protein
MFALLTAAAAAATSPAALKPFTGLEGCWRGSGVVLGKPNTDVARGEWHLGGRYFLLQLRALDPAHPYSAAILYGEGGAAGEVSSYWMDSFGGAYSTTGKGTAAADGISVDYTYPNGVYTNRFVREGRGWHWTIDEKAPGKPARRFAEYHLAPAPCTGLDFSF